ncbi:hypothetical protein K443DRAFT_108549, partial [Laccaria amethystina LaAM-08-1]
LKAFDQFFPKQPVVTNNSIDMNFTIAHHVPIALSLTSAADYAHLTNASKIKKNPTVKVSLTRCMPNLLHELSNLENIATPAQDNGHPELKGPAEKKKKSRACIVPSMLWIICIPLPFSSEIPALREQWECNVMSCKSDVCFLPAEGPHSLLGHSHFEKWAAAIVCSILIIHTILI